MPEQSRIRSIRSPFGRSHKIPVCLGFEILALDRAIKCIIEGILIPIIALTIRNRVNSGKNADPTIGLINLGIQTEDCTARL